MDDRYKDNLKNLNTISFLCNFFAKLINKSNIDNYLKFKGKYLLDPENIS
jgi:hypothetical protein